MMGSSATRAGLVLALGALTQACALESDLGYWARPDASADAQSDAADGGALEPSGDGGGACSSGAQGGCDGDAGSAPGQLLTVTPGPTTSYFADGRSLPAGEYTLVYVDGCWHSGVVSWTVNLGGEGYHVVGGEPEERITMAPGTVGTFMTLGAYGSYEECVAANVGRPGVSFRFKGGPLGLKLESLDPLTLFILLEGGESVGGRSPTFRLTCTGCRAAP
jgi:hypothetical protein